jgi:hypothetical protein
MKFIKLQNSIVFKYAGHSSQWRVQISQSFLLIAFSTFLFVNGYYLLSVICNYSI